MLREVKVGREKLFIHPNFMRLLTSDDHPVLAYGTTTTASPATAAPPWPPCPDRTRKGTTKKWTTTRKGTEVVEFT